MLYQCTRCGQKYDVEQSGEYQCQCGETFTIDTTQVTTQAQCPFCKSPIPADAKKCAHCGEWVKDKPAEPKSNTTYILLALLFGQFGIAEFYVGRITAGAMILILTLLSFALPEPASLFSIGAIWFIQFLCALIIGLPPTKEEIEEYKKNYKPTRLSKFFCWFNWVIVIVFALALIGYLICLHYGVFDKY